MINFFVGEYHHKDPVNPPTRDRILRMRFYCRATDMDIYEWIIKSLAEIGDDESLNLLYSIYCHFENAFLVVHDSLTHYKIFGDQRSPDDHTKCILQLHKPSQVITHISYLIMSIHFLLLSCLV